MGSLAAAIGSVIALIALGAILRRLGVLSPQDNEALNKLIVYLALPALVFKGVHQARLEWGYLAITVVAWATMLACLGAAWVLGRRLKLAPTTLGGFLLVAGLGNTGYLGFPLTIALFGGAEVVKAFFYDIFGTAIALLTIGVLVGERYGESSGETRVLREIVTFPPLVAVAAALALKPVVIPGFLMSAIGHLADLTVPLVMLTIGVSLERKAFSKYPAPLAATAAVKLFAAPAVAWALWAAVSTILAGAPALAGGSAAATGAGAPADVTRAIVVLEASMPSMMLSYVMGLRYRLDVAFIPSAVVLTTIASLATVPLWQAVLRLSG